VHSNLSKFQLYKKQNISFLIASKSWLKLHEWQKRHLSENKISEEPQQLHMFLTGPGATGKTHVVGAVSNVMGIYNIVYVILPPLVVQPK